MSMLDIDQPNSRNFSSLTQPQMLLQTHITASIQSALYIQREPTGHMKCIANLPASERRQCNQAVSFSIASAPVAVQ
jgi:hypothetical protein